MIFEVEMYVKQLQKKSLKKNSGFYGIWAHFHPDTGLYYY